MSCDLQGAEKEGFDHYWDKEERGVFYCPSKNPYDVCDSRHEEWKEGYITGYHTDDGGVD